MSLPLPIVITLLRNNKDDTISMYPHDRRTDAVVVKHRYSENLETDTLIVVRKEHLGAYFIDLFDYIFSTIRMKAVDTYKRITVRVPGLPHFDQEIVSEAHLGELRETLQAMTDFAVNYCLQPWSIAVPRADVLTQPPQVQQNKVAAAKKSDNQETL